jgi:uncharacterized protein (DUF488 family)
VIFTAGHSRLDPDGFLSLLAQGPVELVWDISSFPASRWDWFRRDRLAVWLPEAGIGYRWVPDLGGRRGRRPDPPAGAAGAQAPGEDRPRWREEGFAAYQWHMTTPPFFSAIDRLVEQSDHLGVAIMCAEGVWWRCHRSMVADYLVVAGVDAVHLQPRRTRHGEVMGNRLQRYEPEVVAAWRRHLQRAPGGFGAAFAAGM